MKTRLERAIREWLLLEQRGADQQADRALIGVFERLPPEAVPEGFAERVLARAGLQPVAEAEQSWSMHWGLRAALSLCLVVTGLFLLVIPSYLPSLLGIFNMARVTEVGVSLTAGLSHHLGSGLIVWRILSEAGEIVASTLVSPMYLMALATAVLLCLGAFRALHQIVVSERSSGYVSSV